ncbi:SOS response-associated peptidase [Candidatus Dojkabacteria bacterium]|uniref:Abasic site processing protein n=1 Tax=Candidatus Dojkabacteria bacterium TaxID=2099670 RepID=A0A955IA96_9BACT|nr:SOS response-associated peptidase [Candidatus Dojkabacteria bacterium]
MCYETALTKKPKQIEKQFSVNFAIEREFEPYYHRTGFTHPNLQIIKIDEPNKVYPATWGLIPEWGLNNIEGFRKKYNTLNAKMETLLTSGTYKHSARENRCLIIADGFFEPHKEGKVSIPNFCYIPSKSYEDGRDLFAFAGVYSELDSDLFTCSIITTEANDFFAEVHNVKKRMPLVLDEHYFDDWFDDLNDSQINEIMATGFINKEFKAHPVSRDLYKRGINTNNESIIKPIENNSLF